jgi:hypothetical protein
MPLANIKPLSQWTAEDYYNAARAQGYSQYENEQGGLSWGGGPEGGRWRPGEDSGAIAPGDPRQYYNQQLEKAGYALGGDQLRQWAAKLGLPIDQAAQKIFGPGSQIINDPLHGEVVKAGIFDPSAMNNGWNLPDMEDHSFLANYGGALLIAAPLAAGAMTGAIGAGAAGAAEGVGAAAGAGAGAGAADLGWAMGLTDAAGGSLAVPGAAGSAYTGIGAAASTGAGLTQGGGLGLKAGSGLGLTAPGAAAPTNALLSPSITGGATGIAKAGASMGFLDNLFSASNLMNFAGNIGGALINSNATSKAVGAQTDATNSSNALLASIYGQNREDLAPWRNAGVNALTSLAKLNTPGQQFDQAQLDPGYAFRQQQGEQAINRSAAARGLMGSGRTIKDLIRFNQDYATNEFGNVNNRRLALSGLGQTATNTGVQAGQNYGTQVGQNMLGAGNARASGYVGQANALSGAIGSTLNNYNSNRLLGALIPGYQ